MKYMMFVCTDTEPDTDMTDDVDTWLEDNLTRRLDGDRLASPSTATTVRVRAGELLITDGPFAETKEAIEVARAHPMARMGRLELRPFVRSGR